MFLEWEASSYVTNPKNLWKKFIFSTHRDLKRLLKLITTPCTIPTWPRKKFSQTPRNGVSKKKTKPFKQEILEVGIIYLGDSGPKSRIS